MLSFSKLGFIHFFLTETRLEVTEKIHRVCKTAADGAFWLATGIEVGLHDNGAAALSGPIHSQRAVLSFADVERSGVQGDGVASRERGISPRHDGKIDVQDSDIGRDELPYPVEVVHTNSFALPATGEDGKQVSPRLFRRGIRVVNDGDCTGHL